jgi:hypothetical protein
MRIEEAAFIDGTCSVACSTNTGELHECVCAPFAVGRCLVTCCHARSARGSTERLGLREGSAVTVVI